MGAIFNRKAIYKEITNQIVEMLKQGKIPWQELWIQTQLNFLTKNEYRGFNQFWLNLKMNINRYKTPYWLGFVQTKKLGGRIKKGEKGSQILFFSYYLPCNAEKMCQNCKNAKGCSFKIADKSIKIETRSDIDSLCDNYDPVWKTILKSHVVFNLDQIEGIDPPSVIEESCFDLSKIRRLLESYKDAPPVLEGGNKAAYNRIEDFIRMPVKKLFFSEESYYSTLFHELVHSTGYEKRLNRKSLYSSKGEELYAYEELIAELGAMFLCAEAGIKNEKRTENSAAYIQSWIQVLENNPNWIFKASNEAQKAVDYILNSASVQNQKAA